MSRIYVASSWRNTHQPTVVEELRLAGHQVFDYRHPGNGLDGFHWTEIDPDWQSWTPQEYREKLLTHPLAAKGFLSDFRGMQWCDTCVLVLPSGRSSHLELGWCKGAGKRTIVLLDGESEPELMNLLADDICLSLEEVIILLSLELSESME